MDKKKTITVSNAKKMNMSLRNVAAIRSMGNNVSTVTRSFTKKRSDRRNKNMMNKNKMKSLMSLKRFIVTRSFLEMTHSRAKINNQQGRLANVCC